MKVFNLLFALIIVFTSNSFASFSSGDVISAQEINNKFQNIKVELSNREIPYSFEPVSDGEKIFVSVLNSNFNNFKIIDPLVNIVTLNSGETIKAQSLNQNFLTINQVIQEKFNTRSCVVNNGIGVQNYNAAENKWNLLCTVESCVNSSFHIENNQCLSNVQSCSTPEGTGTKVWTGESYSSCSLNSCILNYHLEGSSCLPDTKSCPINNGVGTQSWNGTSYSSCVVQSCVDSSFHIEGNSCLPNVKVCSIVNGSGSQTWTGSGYSSCLAQSCISESYHIENNQCLSNTQSCSLTNTTNCQKQWQSNLNTYQVTASSSISGPVTYFGVNANKAITVNVSGSIRLGSSGNYTAPAHTSAYGNNSGYAYVTPCPLGAVIYRFGTSQAWRCLVPGSTIINNTGAYNIMYFQINDEDRGNNSGSLSLGFIYNE